MNGHALSGSYFMDGHELQVIQYRESYLVDCHDKQVILHGCSWYTGHTSWKDMIYMSYFMGGKWS